MADSVNITGYDRAAIMRRAWELYRLTHKQYGAWQIERGIVDGSFASHLRSAWAEAKRRQRKMVALTGPYGDRIRTLLEQIDLLQYKGWKHDITTEARALRAEIAELEAA